MSVVVVGSINADLHLRVARHPSPGETLLASGGTISPGGKGANQACAAALTGARTVLLGAVGSDGAREAALRLLKSAGVDLTHLVHLDEAPTGLAVVTVDEAGENTVLVVPGANRLVSRDMVERGTPVIRADGVVVVQGEIPPAVSAAAVREATRRVVVNLAPAIDVEPALLLRADPLVVNEHEGKDALRQLSAHSGGSPGAVVEALLGAGVPSVVLTLGAQGALVGQGTQVVRVAAPRVVAVDTVGAGDAFAGALAARLDAGETLLEAARYATRFAAYTVQHEGAQASYPAAGTMLPELP
ncbi:MAG: ribokinase [Propionibacteriaceae bacterium]|nr:ribokinase [Propionibacteriaceae bacterium]